MRNNKAIVVLTNFWDANVLIDYGFILYKPDNEDKVYKVNLITQRGDSNFEVDSIALSHPPLGKLPNLQHPRRLDFFCPTYDMLVRYKRNKDWAEYTKDYYNLLKDRKEDLKDWMDSLKPNHIYFLCCWENTLTGANCHRRLLYKRILSSEIAREKIFPIYRHGEKIYKETVNGEIQIEIPVGETTVYGSIMGVAMETGQPVTSSGSYVTIVDVNGNAVSRVDTNPDINGIS